MSQHSEQQNLQQISFFQLQLFERIVKVESICLELLLCHIFIDLNDLSKSFWFFKFEDIIVKKTQQNEF